MLQAQGKGKLQAVKVEFREENHLVKVRVLVYKAVARPVTVSSVLSTREESVVEGG